MHTIIPTLDSAIHEMNYKTRTMRHSLCTIRYTSSTLTLGYTVLPNMQPSIGLVNWQLTILNMVSIYVNNQVAKILRAKDYSGL